MRYLALLLAIALTAACAAGCGSRKSAGVGIDPGAPAAGGYPAAGRTGGATVTIAWPPRRARLIPAACNSIRVEMKSGAEVLQSRVADRPAGSDPSTLTFDALPVGALTAAAAAYPEAGAGGTPQAHGSAPIAITEGATANVDLTMGSTIASLTVAPADPAVGVGGSVTLAATARDASSAVVLVAPSVLGWASDSTAVATVDSGGKVAGVAVGTCNVTVTDSESGKSATAAVTVLPQTLTNPKDGQEMVLVPAGAFTMGSDSGGTNEKPVHTVTLSAYYIGKTEVTVAQFRKFVNESGYTPQGSWQDYAWNDQWPVNYVTWNDVKAYCDWAGLRLPTEAEWEKAARGTDARVYPWGNDWDAAKCNSYESGDGFSYHAPVGSFPAGASPYGCLDMAGNVWEWVSDWYSSSYYAASPATDPPGPSSGSVRVIRGGSWNNYRVYVRAANRLNFDPTYGDSDRGFRCARSSN